MKAETPGPNSPPDESLPKAWIEALRTLPSERQGPSNEMDDMVMAMAAAKLAGIRRRRRFLHWGLPLAAAASVALAFGLLFHKPPGSSAPSVAAKTEDPYAVILREVSQVFPSQVKAIFTGGSELRIALAEDGIAEHGQPVVLEISQGGGSSAVITYVGQTVEIGPYQVTVRRDQNGGIVVDSPGTTDSGTPSSSALQIKSRPI